MDEHEIGNLVLNIDFDTDRLTDGINRVISQLQRLSNTIDAVIKKQPALTSALNPKDFGTTMERVSKEYTKSSSSIIGDTGEAVSAVSGLIGVFGSLKGTISGAVTGATSGGGIGAIAGTIVGAIGDIMQFIGKIEEAAKKAEAEKQNLLKDSSATLSSNNTQLLFIQHNMDILEDSSSTVEELTNARNALATTLDGVLMGLDKEGNAILAGNEVLKERIKLIYEENNAARKPFVDNLPDSYGKYAQAQGTTKFTKDLISTASEQLSNPNTPEAIKSSLEHQKTSNMQMYAQNKKDEKESLATFQRDYLEAVHYSMEGFDALSASAKKFVDDFALGLIDNFNGMDSLPGIVEQVSNALENGTYAVPDEATESLYAYSSAAIDAAEQANYVANAAESQFNGLMNLSGAFQTLQEGGSLSAQTLYELASAFPEVNDYIAQTGDLTLNNGQVLQDVYHAKLQLFQQEQELRIQNLERDRDELFQMRNNLKQKVQIYLDGAETAKAAALLSQIDDHTKSIDQINADIAKLRSASETLNAIPFGGGNSGGSKPKSYGSSKNEALQNEIKLLEQKKKMDQVTNEEELAWLERMLGQYRMSAEERQDLEYRIYSGKKKLQDEEEKRLQQQIKQLDELGSAVTSALKARYEEQKEIEQKRIDDSIQSWKDWEEQTVAAIQGQIDALDELEEEQESADKRAEYERNKQALELQKAYEKDLYQREMIQKEINRLDKEEQKRLEQEARDELRKQLEQQIEDAKEQSKQKQEALEKESEALDETYEKLMQDSALKAEAERMLMQASQEDILQLLQSYAPDYEVVGQSMGEKLVEGFTQKVGSIEDYFNRMQAQLDAFHSAVADTANQAADHFYANRAAQEAKIASQAAPSNIQMTVNFNQPVESPIETRRELERAMQSMVVKIQQGG